MLRRDATAAWLACRCRKARLFRFEVRMTMRLLVQIGLVALGSAFGGVSRLAMTTLMARWLGSAYPFGTLTVNISGSFLLGWLSSHLAGRLPEAESAWMRPDDLRLLVGVGFAGSYTTFSTFELEGNSLVERGEPTLGFAYLVGSLALGLLAVRLGVLLGKA